MFKGLELPEEMLTDPKGLRQAYLEEFAKHRQTLGQTCRGCDVQLVECRTDVDAGLALARYLSART